MDKHQLAAKTVIFSFLGMLVLLIFAVSTEPIEGNLSFTLLQIFGGILTIFIFIPGMYLWVTGFERFEIYLNHSASKKFMYVSFTFIYAVYLQLKYGNQVRDS